MKLCETSRHCASCYAQYTDKTYVDLDAAYDGPVIEGGVVGPDGDVVNKIPVSIDDLVLCEDCLREAGSFIGLTDTDADKIAELQQIRQQQAEEILGLKQYVKKLEDAVASKPEAPKRATKART